MNQQAFDQELLNEIYDMDPDTYREVIDSFCSNWPEYLELIRAAHADGDGDRLMRAAHKVKGSSRTLGLVALGETCQNLETQARSGDLSRCGGLLQLLQERGNAACIWLVKISDR